MKPSGYPLPEYLGVINDPCIKNKEQYIWLLLIRIWPLILQLTP